MTKSNLIATLARKNNLTEKQSTEIINLIFTGFTDTLIKGDRIEIRGFGSFSVREYSAYTGRNPRTGEKVDVRAKRGVFFKVGKELRERVDNLI
jgi:integration host factor subunit beta